MKKDRNLVVKILFVCLAVLLVSYFMFNRKTDKRYQWTESYKANSDQPYGTLFIQKLLADYRPGQKFIINDNTPLHKILDTTKIKGKTDYIFIGQDLYLDEADKNALLSFISAGNDAFLATVNLPFDIVDPIFVPECDRDIFLTRDDTVFVEMNFYNTALKTDKGYIFAYRFGKKDVPYFWNTLNSEVFCNSTTSITPLGYIDPDKVNFFKLSYGKGTLYIHSNPLVFSNYFLTKPDKVEYSSRVFSHLQGQAIIWDEFSKSPFIPKNNAPEISPISYILQQESLRYAWWLILASVLLYTLFTAKRKQRAIPVLEEKTNTSLEFIEMISALHFQNANHHDIARKKMKYFFHFIKAKYGLHTQSLTDAQLKRLAEKSKVSLDELQFISQEFQHIGQQQHYIEARLVYLHNAIKKFYKYCK